ncbi:putative baseplate assembly protein V [Aeromonas phage Ahp2]|nr:putative baseplate assembly protein V [Aeromonas phage Ahp2]
MSVMERLEAIERKLEQMVVRGTIAKVDCNAKRVTVAWGDGLESDWIEWKPTRSGGVTIWSPPQVGEGVTVISDGDINQGEAFLGSYHNSMPSPSSDPDDVVMKMPDGTVFTYNHKAHKLHIEVKGETLIDVTGNLTATAGGDVTVESGGEAKVKAAGAATVEAGGAVTLKGSGISMEGGGSGSMSAGSGGVQLGSGGGAGVVTGAHICAYTGAPHAACSSVVFAAG